MEKFRSVGKRRSASFLEGNNLFWRQQTVISRPNGKNPTCVFPNDPPIGLDKRNVPWLCEVTGRVPNTDVLRLMPFLRYILRPTCIL